VRRGRAEARSDTRSESGEASRVGTPGALAALGAKDGDHGEVALDLCNQTLRVDDLPLIHGATVSRSSQDPLKRPATTSGIRVSEAFPRVSDSAISIVYEPRWSQLSSPGCVRHRR
jgi:hypothetical protein